MSIAKDSTLTSGRLRGVVGPLAKVPFTIPVFTAVGTGSAASLGTIQPNNADGKNQQAVLTTGAGPTCYSGVKDVVYGPVVGIRIPRTSGSTRPPFDVEIDGVVYPIDVNANPRFDNIAQISVTDYESLIVVADNLPDRAHTVKIHLAADVTAAPVARTLSMFGWVAAQGRGYHQPPVQRVGGVASATPTVLTSTATQISVAGLCSGLTLENEDTVARTVTITGPDGVTPWRKVYLAISGTTGDTQTIDVRTPRTLNGYKWSTDAGTASKVKGWVEVI